ncbi:MAG TPA: alpha/beta hydrolase, partial [Kouleothrix sp.]|nr:alpha/beta hydrolase [Kouleothrix sp.]
MATPALRMRAAHRRATALYCTLHGSGTPLLLLHGLGATGAIFRPIIPALARRFQVIVPDLRGHGHSTCLPGPDSIDRMAADVANLLDLLNIPSCLVLGYASGGAVAQQLALRYPARVRGLALVCA